jgi:histone H3/H4
MNRTPLSLSRIVVEAATHRSPLLYSTRAADPAPRPQGCARLDRSLHAAAFSCSSTHASAILADLLARYIQLLANTAAKYAQHAGCTSLTTTDTLEALDGLGFGLQDFIDCVPEAKDLSCYAIHSGRCIEELNKFKAQLGRVQCDDIFSLTYAPYGGG